MLALTWLEPGIVLAIVGGAATAWGMFRAGTAQAWKSTAEGRGEELADLRGRVTRVEQENVTLRAEVTRLEALPDLSEIMDCLRKIERTLDAFDQRWG